MTEAPSFDDAWSAGHSYEAYMGHWSRWVAMRFTRLARTTPGFRLDRCRLRHRRPDRGDLLHDCAPALDAGDRLLRRTSSLTPGNAIRGRRASASQWRTPRTCRAESGTLDVAVSALVLNFLPDRLAALARDAARR